MSKNNSVNKKLQNFCIENMLHDPNKKAARKTLNIMITLYKKKIWNDAKTVNAIGQACYSGDLKIVFAACQFFLSEYEEEENDTSDEEELGELKNKYKLLGKGNNKKTKARKDKIKKLMKAIERRDIRKSKLKQNKDFMPIDQLNDPTGFCDKLFNKLKSVKENFKMKVALMRLIGRVAGRHKLVINNFFNFMLNYLIPNQKELSVIFAALCEACHEMVLPSDLEPVIDKLFDSFISEAHPAQYITIGLNTLREICERAPFAMTKDKDKDNIQVIVNLKDYKNKSVNNAARSLVNLFKESNPELLDIYDGEFQKSSGGIDGIDLLRRYEKLPEGYRMELDTILDDAQLKKLRLLKMKYAAEKVQRKKVDISENDMEEMLGRKRKRTYKEDEEVKEGEVEEDDGEELEELESMEEGEECEELEDDEEGEDDEELEELEDMEEGEEAEELEDDDEEGEELKEDEIEIDSEELKNMSDEKEDDEDNNHGFLNPENLLTYKKKYTEKADQLKNEEKEQYKHTRKPKAGGLTNKQKLKSKPMAMVINKKRHVQEKVVSMNKKMKKIKKQLGRFKRGNMILKKKGGMTNKKKAKNKKQ